MEIINKKNCLNLDLLKKWKIKNRKRKKEKEMQYNYKECTKNLSTKTYKIK